MRDEAEELHVQVALDWRLVDARRVTSAVRRQDVLASSFCAAGECVLTSFGTGVVLDFRPEDRMHRVQLWGPLGQGRNTAYLREDALLAVLPAAAGISVETAFGNGICRAVRVSRCSAGDGAPSSDAIDSCQVVVDLPWAKAAVLQASCVSCPVAMTLPLVSRFIDRAADLTRIHSGTLSRLRETMQSLGLEQLQERLTAQASDVVEAASQMWGEWEAKDAKDVVDNLWLKADEVLADPQMRDSMQAVIRRLNKMECSSRGFDGVWVGSMDGEARCHIDDAVVHWHWGEATELEIWSSDEVSTAMVDGRFSGRLQPDGSLVWTDGDRWVRVGELPNSAGAPEADDAPAQPAAGEGHVSVLQRSLQDFRRILSGDGALEGGFEEALSSLSRVASSDEEVKQLVEVVQERRKFLLTLRSKVMDTRAAQVLTSGKSLLGEQLARLQDTTIAPELERVQQRSMRLMTRLTTDRKVKQTAGELFSVARARFSARVDHSSMETWVEVVKERVVGRLAAHRSMLVDNLRGLQLQQVDLAQLVRNSWDPEALERQLERSLLAAIKLSGLESGSGAELLDKFDDQNIASQIPAVRQTSQSILALLGELNIDVPGPVREVLEAQSAGQLPSGKTWEVAMLGALDDESVVRGAEQLILKGENLLRKAQQLKENKTIARVVGHLESEDIERSLLQKIYSLNPEAMIAEAECALTHAEAREKLVSQLKDTCLDFILKILPAIHIEKATGSDNGCDWEINDINFSDFSFRKENVHISLGDPNDASEELLRVSAWGISAHFRNLRVAAKQTAFPYMAAECMANARADGMSVSFAFRLLPADAASPTSAAARGVRVWGRGEAAPPSAPGSSGGGPRLVMSSRSVFMENLELVISDNNYAVLVNALTFLFADVLKHYACQKIAQRIDEHMGVLIDGLNAALTACAPYLVKLGFQLPEPRPAPPGARGFDDVGVPTCTAMAVPRLAGRAQGWDGDGLFPEEIDWADPGRAFAVRV